MISNQMVQNTLNNSAAITGVSAAVYDRGGKIIALKGDVSAVDERELNAFIDGREPEHEARKVFYIRTDGDYDTVYTAAVIKKGDNSAEITARFLKLQLENLLSAANDKMDRDDFIKNLLLDNLLQIDIFNRARKLNIEFKAPRAVYVIESNGNDSVYDIIKDMIASRPDDFATGIDEGNQIVVHEIMDADNAKEELAAFARDLYKAFDAKAIDTFISYGSVVSELKNLSISYKEARLAHNVRRIFYEDSKIISYDGLGIGRLIYQLPLNLCRMFINEIFGSRNLDEFDEETLVTINKFFENNLNVSETSRQLFIHRNTLVYRLDKLQKTAGLDLRVFDDAITFKIALMVVKYVEYMDKLDF